MSYKSHNHRYASKQHRSGRHSHGHGHHHRLGRHGHREDRRPHGHKRHYRKYYHQQPSDMVYVEEPTDNLSEELSEEEEESYDFALESNSEMDSSLELELLELELETDSDFDDARDIMFYDNVESDGVSDLDDDELLDLLEEEGIVAKLNDELVAYYDSELELELELDSDDVEEILDIIDLNDQLQAQAMADLDSDLEYSSDEETLDDQLKLEAVRQFFEDEMVSLDEISDSETEFDAGNPDLYQFICDNCEDEEDELTDDEGLTIYRHVFDLPEDEDDLTDEELMAEDSDDEPDIVDLTSDLIDSKDIEVEEGDDHYKVTIRLPSIDQDELKIDFKKAENELVVNGKFDFTIDDGEDDEIEAVVTLEEQDDTTPDSLDSDSDSEDSEDSDSEDSDDSDDSDSEDSDDSEDSEDSDSDSDSDLLDSSDSEAEAEEEQRAIIEAAEEAAEALEDDDDEDFVDDDAADVTCDIDDDELLEDAQYLTKDFQGQEIGFEKHFQFDKLVAWELIIAKFNDDGELEITVPHTGVDYLKEVNYVPIAIQALSPVLIADVEEADVDMDEE